MARPRNVPDAYSVKTGATASVVSSWSNAYNAKGAAREMRRRTGEGYFVVHNATGNVVLDLLPRKGKR
jgi:hypothetical protein